MTNFTDAVIEKGRPMSKVYVRAFKAVKDGRNPPFVVENGLRVEVPVGSTIYRFVTGRKNSIIAGGERNPADGGGYRDGKTAEADAQRINARAKG